MAPLPALYVVFHTDEADTVFKFPLPSSHLTQDVYRHFQKRIVSAVLNIPRSDRYEHIYPLNYFMYGYRGLTENKPGENERPGESIQIIYTNLFYQQPFQVFMIQSLDAILPVDEIGNEFISMKLTNNKMVTITVPDSWEVEDELEGEWMTQMRESISQTYV